LEMLTPELAKGLQNRQRIIIEDLTAEVTRLRTEAITTKAALHTAAGDVGRLSDLLAEAKVSLKLCKLNLPKPLCTLRT
jgi:hypothetical protein